MKRALLIALFATTWGHAAPDPPSEILEALRNLPEVTLDRKAEFKAEIQDLPRDEAGLSRHGFAFKTPNLVDGPGTWLVVWEHEQPALDAWEVTNSNGTVLEVLSPSLVDLKSYPILTAKYPNAKSIQRVRIKNNRLIKATRYQAVLATRAENPPLGIYINVAADGVGMQPGEEIREMEIPEGPIPAMQVIQLVENIRMFQGDDLAIEFLDAQFAEKAKRMGAFNALFIKVWHEAQFGAGMDDSEWGSRLNDVAFISTHRIGHYARSFEILLNLCSSLSASARFGRLAEVHALFEDAYQKGGQNMDTTAYPDLGPALLGLPAIRHRDISIATPFVDQPPEGEQLISRPSSFNHIQAGTLLSYATQRMNRGDWQGAIEWAVWIRRWASDDQGMPLQPRNGIWYSATFNIAGLLESLGFTEDALALIEEAVAAPYGRNYRGRAKINATRLLLEYQRKAGRPDPEMIPKLRDLITQMENHVHFWKSPVWSAKINLAHAHFDGGQFEEGDRLIEEIIEEGSYSARWTRLDRWLATGTTDGVEAELIAMLKHTRESGHKISELDLYSKYADFLESTERFQEALAMRNEAVRLARDFNAFTKLPVQLAKLAALLHKLGYADLAAKSADEARSLLSAGNMPPSTLESVTKNLAGITPELTAPKPEPMANQPGIDLQPHRGLVVPLEGAPWAGYLTLANPGTTAIRGMLEISGPSHLTKEEGDGGDIRVELNDTADHGAHSTLSLDLDPGSYRLITVAADQTYAGEDEVHFSWRSSESEHATHAAMLIDHREQGVAGAIIQAGNYQANPFYGVPIHLNYVATDQRDQSSPLRFIASQTARIEIHLIDGTPLAVDGTGNGSLLDSGDELFSETDGAGNLQVALTDGVAALRIIAYPRDPIAEEGLLIDIEVLDDGQWSLHSRNKIEP